MTSRDLKAINRAIDAVWWHEQGATTANIAEKLGISRKYVTKLVIDGSSDPKIREAVEMRKRYEKDKLEEADEAATNQSQKA